MARIFVKTTARKTRWAPYALSNYQRVLRAADCDIHGNHELCQNADAADLILFVESKGNFHFDILSDPVFKRHKNKCHVFDMRDNSIPKIPGLYLGFDKALYRYPIYKYGFYLRVFDNSAIQAIEHNVERKYLYSFVGNVANSDSVRGKILRLPQENALLLDRSSGQSDGDQSYVDVIAKSRFVLCPRGVGPSTWRLFEVMSAGRVPVIVSDGWMPPVGPNWEKFSVIVPEENIEQIPQMLLSLESRADEMGRIARQEWKAHFSVHSAFNWIGNALVEIQKCRSGHQQMSRRNRLREVFAGRLARPYFKELIRHRLGL